MADVNNNAKLRDVMGVPFYPMTVDSNGVDVRVVIDDIKNTINNIKTIITNIHTNIDDIEADLNSLLNELNEYISAINKRLSILEGSSDDLDTTGLMRIYTGPSDLYVNHKYSGGNNDGSESKPFSSFTQLNNYLNFSKTINKSLTIHIETSGEYVDHLGILDFAGTGSLTYTFNTDGKFSTPEDSNIECGIKVVGVKVKLLITGYRVYGSVHGILCYRSDRVEITNSIINAPLGYGVLLDDSCGYVHACDFVWSQCAVCAEHQNGNACCEDLSGNGKGDAFRTLYGGTIHYGKASEVTTAPKGILRDESGNIYKYGTVDIVDSWNYPPDTQPPIPPSTSDYNASFNATDLGTYQYKWSNWSETRECKSGVYSSYGDKAGHIFFDLTAVRNFLNSGRTIDGASITLTRANSGGTSAATDIWVGGSSAAPGARNGAPATAPAPAYGDRAKVGSLAWGESKSFNLNKDIVDGIKSGAYNSITTYGSGYTNITACSIVLRVNK